MKYLIRIIALPFWASIYLIFAISRVFKRFFTLCFDFIAHGGEQITNDNQLNRNTIFEVYKKIEQMEASMNIDSRSNCNHVWEQTIGYGSTSAPRQKCVICGVENTIKTF
jgi:hypothetical protein